MVKHLVFLGALVVGVWLLPGCVECLEQGKNGVPDPEAGEFQLVFNNIVSRETDLFVDGEKVGVVCQETEYATVGNFPVSETTVINAHTRISDSDCYISPCCTSICSSQECYGQPHIDTTPFAGRTYDTGLIWLD